MSEHIAQSSQQSQQISSHQDVAYPTFTLIRQQYIESLNTTVYEFRHQATGAIHYHLANESDENVFLVAFRTQPMDNKGTAHILEHTVLCGSQKYPVRDPFFAMIHRSLNTFMNAFTHADWTCYPFATQNKKDFDNLLSVYLDAVFFANLNELDFAQEGIRIELEQNKPVFKGVVFNEMKGAMSSPSSQLYHKLAQHLYSKTTYHYNSGGDPKDIPDLTHQQLVEFYHHHYHPSNAILMTFGDHQIYDLQEKFEHLALSKFQRGHTIHSIAEQRLQQPIQVTESYAIDSEDLTQKTYHVLSWLLPETTNIKLRLGFRLVEGVLMEDSASPLRNYLETSKLGQSVGPFMGVDDSAFEMVFYCAIQGSEPDRVEQFEQGVMQKLQEIAQHPIDSKAIEAILHQIELHQREVSGDSMPYGLNLLLSGLGGVIHHGDPIAIWDIDQALSDIRQELQDPMWLSNLIQTYLIDNPHRVRLTLQPDTTITQQEQLAEQARLDLIEKNLSENARQEIIQKTEALKQRQATPDDLDLLPKVTLADIPAELKYTQGNVEHLSIHQQTSPVHVYHTGTNGLFYQQVLFHVDQDIIYSPYLNLLSLLVGEVGAGELDYLQLQQRQTAISGGIGLGLSLRANLQDPQHKIHALLALTTKALHRHQDAMDLLYQAFNQIRFDEKDRIIELLQQRKTNWQARISNSAHSYAMQIASRNMNTLAQRNYHITGLPALRWLGNLIEKIQQDDQSYQEFIQQLQALQQRILNSDKTFLLVCESQYQQQHLTHLQHVWSAPTQASQFDLATPSFEHQTNDEAWLIQTNVQFCASAYQVVDILHPDAAALLVLGNYLRNGFLHSAIREQGGAYGGGAGYDSNLCAFRFYSYRDPRLSETFTDFERSIDWLLHDEHPSHLLEEAILGIIASMDKPGSPAGEAITTCYSNLHGRDHAFRKKHRQRILAVDLADLRRVTKNYLWQKTPTRAVVAPFNRQDELLQLGFQIQRIDDSVC